MCADQVWHYWKEMYQDIPDFETVTWLQNRCREILKDMPKLC